MAIAGLALLAYGIVLVAGGDTGSGWIAIAIGAVVVAAMAGRALGDRDLPYRRLRGATVTLLDPDPRRGSDIAAAIALDGPLRDGDELRVGLIAFAGRAGQETGYGVGPSRRRVVHEEWTPSRPAAAEVVVRIAVPADAPYSQDGDDWVEWLLTVRLARRLRPDPLMKVPIWVRP